MGLKDLLAFKKRVSQRKSRISTGGIMAGMEDGDFEVVLTTEAADDPFAKDNN